MDVDFILFCAKVLSALKGTECAYTALEGSLCKKTLPLKVDACIKHFHSLGCVPRHDKRPKLSLSFPRWFLNRHIPHYSLISHFRSFTLPFPPILPFTPQFTHRLVSDENCFFCSI
jgi:hypothetical protein